jgi:hypothetical protein
MIGVSQQQIRFFDELLNEKQFPEGSPSDEELRTQFAALSKKSGSEWIEKAINLPKKDDDDSPVEPPPF